MIDGFSLINTLQEIQSLSQILLPLLDEEGRGAFQEFILKLREIIESVFPTYTVAIVGPVNSGKSTLLSSLLKEGKDHPIASIGPSNETFTPMVISYGPNPSLILYYFDVGILDRIEQRLQSIKRKSNASHEIAQYKEIKAHLAKIEAIKAGELGVVQRIDLPWQQRALLVNEIRKYTSLSGGSNSVYGVYKAEITFPGEVLRNLNNARFVDMFGFGEPSPLVQLKLSRFIAEEQIDVWIYVFPDRAITESFYRLFETPHFIEDVVAKGRLIVVLNKADAYPDVERPGQWLKIIEEFRRNLVRHVPVLKRYLPRIPVFIMSAASIDGTINHKRFKEIRRQSLRNLQSLRDYLRKISRQVSSESQSLSLYLTSIFDLLEALDLLAEGAQDSLARLEKDLPEIAQVLDYLSANERQFARERERLLEGFRADLQHKLEEKLAGIEYDSLVKIVPSELNAGNPPELFRGLVKQSQRNIERIYQEELQRVFAEVAHFVDERLLEAYRKYVALQDEAIQRELARLKKPKYSLRPLRVTVDRSAREILKFSSTFTLHHSTLSLLRRFANWYLRQRYQFDIQRGQSMPELYLQVKESVRETIETFMKVYVCEDPSLRNAFLSQIRLGGEPTFWEMLREHVLRLNRVLAEQIQITKWRFGLYQNKVFFVSHKQEFQGFAKELMKKRETAQEMVIEML